MDRKIENAYKIYLRAIFFLFPVISIGILPDPFVYGKILILLLWGFVGLGWWIIGALKQGRVEIKWSMSLNVLLLLTVWNVISILGANGGVWSRNLVNKNGILMWTGLFLANFLLIQDERDDDKRIDLLMMGCILISIVPFVVLLINRLMPITGWINSGSFYNQSILMMVGILYVLKKKDFKNRKNILFFGVIVFIGVMNLLLLVRSVKEFSILDMGNSIVVMGKSILNSPIYGIGGGNFIEAFYKYRTVGFNLLNSNTDRVYLTSAMGWMQIGTELGVVALGMWGYLIFQLLQIGKRNWGWWFNMFLVAMVLIFPMSVFTLFLMGTMIKINVTVIKTKLEVFFAILICLMIGFVSFMVIRLSTGEYLIKKSVEMLVNNREIDAYNLERKAIEINSYSAEYYKVYSRTNLILAYKMRNINNAKSNVLEQEAVKAAKMAA
jgi:hypothetical protein